jgi:hypothetical protein
VFIVIKNDKRLLPAIFFDAVLYGFEGGVERVMSAALACGMILHFTDRTLSVFQSVSG